MRIVALAGGIGGARFLRGLLRAVGPGDEVTVVANTADDISLFGLRICPDLDTLMYTLGGGIDEERGWGRAGETWAAKEELAAYDVPGAWFGLGDRDLATHLVRTQMLTAGYPLSEVTRALCARWRPGVRLLPMSDDRVETHVVVERDGRRQALHFQEWWVRLGGGPDVLDVVAVGAEDARPAAGVLDALAAADLVVLPPSNPVVSIGTVLGVPGLRDAVAARPVVGLSPVVGGAPVRGMADRLLPAVGVAVEAGAVATDWYARRFGADLLDGWLVDTRDADALPRVQAAGIACRAVPLLMSDADATTAMARAALDLASHGVASGT
ncbi:MAG: 2-phospho-L-lactate transferase [Actinomycetota bacterium]|jgi:LPPG:FO 2-phospho-L-lactate transferase|nr:2-phospho-L-lactate transferase [Actinomycetota bacterium]